MPNLRFTGFQGEHPQLDPRNLPDMAAQRAANVFLTSGRIDPISEPVIITKTQHRVAKSIYELSEGIWLAWDADVNVARSPIAGDTQGRVYFSSDTFEPRVTNTALATEDPGIVPSAWYVLGITPPVTAPTVATSGGSGTQEARVYVYTFVTEWGEESAPSPASNIVTGYLSGSWSITGMDVAPLNTGSVSAASVAAGVATLTLNSVFGLRAGEVISFAGALAGEYKLLSVDKALNKVTVAATTVSGSTGTWTRVSPHHTANMTKRVYRSVTTDTTNDYFYVGEVPVATTSFTDSTSAADLGESLPTLGWDMPPVDLQGIAVLPSGAMVGFRENEVCFSEPTIPYAWPQAYRMTTDYKIVGIGLLGTSVVVMTTGQPYVTSGNDPAAMTMERLNQAWPCLSKRGIAVFNNAVFYPTTVGLAMVSMSGSQIATTGLYTQREWVTVNPDQFTAGYYDNRYYAVTTVDGGTKIVVITPNQDVTLLNIAVDGLYSSPRDGYLYATRNFNVVKLGTNDGLAIGAEWRSKDVILPKPTNLTAAKVEAEFVMTEQQAAAAAAANQAIIDYNQSIFATDTLGEINGAEVNVVEVNGSAMKNQSAGFVQSIKLLFYQGDDLVFSKDVVSDRIFRLPGGSKYYRFSVGIATNVPVYSVVIGDTPTSLEQV
jgi:hypothetical protein